MPKDPKEIPLIIETDHTEKPKWVPLVIISAIILIVILAFAFMSGGKHKDKDDYMKLLQEHQDSVKID